MSMLHSPSLFLKALCLLAVAFVVSCEREGATAPPESDAVDIVPRLHTANGEAPPTVDSVRVTLWTGTDSAWRRSAAWKTGALSTPQVAKGYEWKLLVEGVHLGVDRKTESVWWASDTIEGRIEDDDPLVDLRAVDVDLHMNDTTLPVVRAAWSGRDTVVSGGGTVPVTLVWSVDDASGTKLVVRVGDSLADVSDGRATRVVPVGESDTTLVLRVTDANNNLTIDTLRILRRTEGLDASSIAPLVRFASAAGVLPVADSIVAFVNVGGKTVPTGFLGDTVRMRLQPVELGARFTVQARGLRREPDGKTWSVLWTTDVHSDSARLDSLGLLRIALVANLRDTTLPSLRCLNCDTLTTTWLGIDTIRIPLRFQTVIGGALTLGGKPVILDEFGAGGATLVLLDRDTVVRFQVTDATNRQVVDSLRLHRKVNALVVAPDTGELHDTATGRFTTATPGTQLRCTREDRTPLATDPSCPESFRIDSSVTWRARGFRDGIQPSETFVASWRLEVDSLSVSGWTDSVIEPPRAIRLRTNTPGAVIRYRLDGAEPTVDDPVYAESLVVWRSGTLAARAFRDDFKASPVLIRKIAFRTSEVSIVGWDDTLQNEAPTVSMSCRIDSAEIRYRLDGKEPSRSDSLYRGPFELDRSATVAARAFRAGVDSGEVATKVLHLKVASVSITGWTDTLLGAPPTAAISCPTSQAEIRYRLDGKAPTVSDSLYRGPFVVEASSRLVARAFRSGFDPSDTAVRVARLRAGAVTISGLDTLMHEYPSAVLSCTTSQAEIRYRLDGQVPTESDSLYHGPFAIGSTSHLVARAFRSGFEPGAAASKVVRLEAARPKFVATTRKSEESMAIEPAVALAAPLPAGSRIFYSTDGTLPDSSMGSELVTDTLGGFIHNALFIGRTYRPGMDPSPPCSVVVRIPLYTPRITLLNKLDTLRFGVQAGYPNSTIRYTIDGADPTSSSPLASSTASQFLGEWALPNGVWADTIKLKVRGWNSLFDSSAVAESTFVVVRRAKSVAKAGGTFTIGHTSDSVYGSKSYAQIAPQANISLTGFIMDQTEVTVAEYQAIIGAIPGCVQYRKCTNCAMNNVSFFDAVRFSNERSKAWGLDTVYTWTAATANSEGGTDTLVGLSLDLTKNGFRLPTEAEWEYAALNGEAKLFPWGDESSVYTIQDKAAWLPNFLQRDTFSVATKLAYGGLYDMAGGMEEWTMSSVISYSMLDGVTDPAYYDPNQNMVVLRGGNFQDLDKNTLSSRMRNASFRGYRYQGIGFRCVRRP